MNDLFVFLLSVAGLVVSIIAFVAIYQLFAIRRALDALVRHAGATVWPQRVTTYVPAVRADLPARAGEGARRSAAITILILCAAGIILFLTIAAAHH
jgi:hypothetical protein